jgi:hypothetical protein
MRSLVRRARKPGAATYAALLSGLLLTACGTAGLAASTGTSARHPIAAHGTHPGPLTTTPTTPSTTGPATTTSTPPTSAAPPPTPAGSTTTSTVHLAPATPGFVTAHVSAVGDSVMMDYQDELEADIPGISVYAAVSRQWSEGEAILQQLKSEGQLGSIVVVALGTNGEITSSDFDSMMAILSGASRVIFVNVHVDQPYQDSNNAVLANGVSRYPNTMLVDWASLAAANPQWFGSDGTHLAIDGPGTQQLAAMIASDI